MVQSERLKNRDSPNQVVTLQNTEQAQQQTRKCARTQKDTSYLKEPFMLPVNKTSVSVCPCNVCTSTRKCSKAQTPILSVPRYLQTCKFNL